MDFRELIARRVAQELRDNTLVNLGIGLPTSVARFVPPDLRVYFQSENGIIGFWDPAKGPKGKYVTWPDYDRNHLVARHYRLRGPTARLYRYSHPSAGRAHR